MAFLPIGDDNKRSLIGTPWVTWGLIFANFVVFVIQQGVNPFVERDIIYGYGMIPAVLMGDAMLPSNLASLPPWATLVSSQFLHGGWDHLLGNMLFLWIFGDNVEDALGHLRFLLFYLACGVLAGLGFAAMEPGSQVPMIGASGSISAVLGAYLLLHPYARIIVLILFVPIRLPAWFLLVGWFGFQFYALGMGQEGVAWIAHITGFLAGALVIPLARRRGVPLLRREPPQRVIAIGRFRKKPRSAPSGGQERRPPGPWGR